MPLLVILRFVLIILVEIIAFFFFYSHSYGKGAVYRTWYAWIIDILAIASGTTIMGLSVYALHSPWIFTIKIPGFFFWLTFIIGGWQASIHLVKWLIRLTQK